jgi:hypothetical protein
MKVLLQSYNYYVENSNLVSSCKRLIHIIFFCKEFDTYQFIIQKHEQVRSGLYPDLAGSPLHDRVRTQIQPGRHSTQGHAGQSRSRCRACRAAEPQARGRRRASALTEAAAAPHQGPLRGDGEPWSATAQSCKVG